MQTAQIFRQLFHRGGMDFSGKVLDQVAAYRPKLVAFMRRKGQRLEDAEDVAQEAILRALGSKEVPRNVPAWLGTIALNLVRDRARSAAVRERHAFKDTQDYDHFFNTQSAKATDQVTKLRAQEIVKQVSTMQPEVRRTFYLHCVEGLTLPEVAQITGQALEAQKTRFHRLKNQLTGHPRRKKKAISSSEGSASRPPCIAYLRRGSDHGNNERP